MLEDIKQCFVLTIELYMSFLIDFTSLISSETKKIHFGFYFIFSAQHQKQHNFTYYRSILYYWIISREWYVYFIVVQWDRRLLFSLSILQPLISWNHFFHSVVFYKQFIHIIVWCKVFCVNVKHNKAIPKTHCWNKKKKHSGDYLMGTIKYLFLNALWEMISNTNLFDISFFFVIFFYSFHAVDTTMKYLE